MKPESELERKVKRLAQMQPSEKDEFFGEYIKEKDGNVKAKVNKVMKQGDFEELVQYAWEKRWKSGLKIPELVGVKEIRDTLGVTVYTGLGIKIGNPQELLGRCIENYGVIDDKKARVFIEEKCWGEMKTLSNAFFSGEEKKENARKLVVYAWEHEWESKLKIPELVGAKEIMNTLGEGVYTALGIKEGNPQKLLERCIDGYGTLDSGKAQSLVGYIENTQESNKTRAIKTKLDDIFFSPENKNHEDNAKKYLEAYQIRHQKRRCDLTEDDIENLPTIVRQILGINTVQDIGNIEETDPEPEEMSAPGYRVVQIRWTEDLEQRLRVMVQGEISAGRDPVAFLRENEENIWNNLGTTPHAATLKAQELGLIAQTTAFGNEPAPNRMPTYPLHEFNGYKFKDYAIRTAEILQNGGSIDEIDVHIFVSPVHGQIIHVNTPIAFKGIGLEQGYTPFEACTIKALAAYLKDPGQFERVKRDGASEEKGEGIKESSWAYKAPENLDVNPKIVPVRLQGTSDEYQSGEQCIAQVFLRERFSRDPGGIHTAVLQTEVEGQTKEIFVFRHT